jgi:hypothetical protein
VVLIRRLKSKRIKYGSQTRNCCAGNIRLDQENAEYIEGKVDGKLLYPHNSACKEKHNFHLYRFN